MPTQTTDLFLIEDLERAERTSDLTDRDRDALHAVADWITSFVVKPHADLGRPGTVCPYVPVSVERQVLWLAPEQIGDRGVPDVVRLMNGYKRRLLELGPDRGEVTDYHVIVVVFPDLAADRAQSLFDDVLEEIAVPSYVEDGILFGPYWDGNQAAAIYNKGFRPFRSPVPFLFVRHGVVGDWKFFLEQPDWLAHWAHRYGEAGTQALAEELRRLPWNARRG